MRVFNEVSKYIPVRSVVLSIGNFDGLHLGHQYLLGKNIELASNLNANSCLLSFFPHPKQLLNPVEPRFPLSLQNEQELGLENIGIDDWIIEPFTQQLREEPPHSFIERIVKTMSLKAIVVGPDFRFGRNRDGDVSLLKTLSSKIGYQVLVPEPFLCQGKRVSSSLIRQFLMKGEIEQANVFLGRSFNLSGKVISGARRGRTIGFPTANIFSVCANNLRKGVYYTIVYLNGQRWKAATNIGIHPTFEDSTELKIETHILDFSENIYGDNLKIEFVKFIRPELKFSSISELKSQIEKDIQIVRES